MSTTTDKHQTVATWEKVLPDTPFDLQSTGCTASGHPYVASIHPQGGPFDTDSGWMWSVSLDGSCSASGYADSMAAALKSVQDALDANFPALRS